MLIEPMLKANKVVVNKFSEVAIKLQKRAGLSDHQQLTPAQTTSHSCWPWMTTSPPFRECNTTITIRFYLTHIYLPAEWLLYTKPTLCRHSSVPGSHIGNYVMLCYVTTIGHDPKT